MPRNERLYDAIRQSAASKQSLAETVGVDNKTIERWINEGRLPRPAHRQKVAQHLGMPEAILWPEAPGVAYGTSELIGIYTTRRELSAATVSSLLDGADLEIDILAYAALWLWDTVPDFTERLRNKIASGATVRICLGDPDSQAVKLRGHEEGIQDALAARCELAAAYARPIHEAQADTVRVSGATLYASILRFDSNVLLNTHVWGSPAADAPVLHLRRDRDDGIAARAIRSFERVWTDAQPLSGR